MTEFALTLLRLAFLGALWLFIIITVIALNMAYLVVGVVVIEAVFVYPGLGQYMVDAVSKRDVPVIQACGLTFATVFVLLNTLADILVIVVNPRLRHQR